MNTKHSFLILAVASALLAGCGGGGGGSEDAPQATPAEVSFESVTPASGMTWATSSDAALNFTVTTAQGAAAADAAVRLFTFSMVSPQDGSALAEPVAMDALASGATDAQGRITLDLRVPGHVTEVLVVVTAGDQQVSRRVVVSEAVAAPVALTLAGPAT